MNFDSLVHEHLDFLHTSTGDILLKLSFPVGHWFLGLDVEFFDISHLISLINDRLGSCVAALSTLGSCQG
jgi:hypothetical protein